MVGDLVLDAQTTEPAVRQIDPNLCTDPSLRPDSKDVADEQHSDHEFRVDRRASGVPVERRKLLVDPAKIEHSINAPYHMIGWNHLHQDGMRRRAAPDPLSADPSSSAPDIDRVSSTESRFAAPSTAFCNTISGKADIREPHANVRL